MTQTDHLPPEDIAALEGMSPPHDRDILLEAHGIAHADDELTARVRKALLADVRTSRLARRVERALANAPCWSPSSDSRRALTRWRSVVLIDGAPSGLP